jgi:hypothetical protein
MSNEGFLRRWSRLKSHADSAQPGSPRDVVHAPPRAADGAGASLQRADELQALDLPPVAQTAPHPPVAPSMPDAAPRTQPSLEDVAALGPDSDFSAFVSQGVDKTVQRLAMKKLFSDPHFSILDGLDVYIDDYTKADPIPAAMLASLDHAKSMFSRLTEDENKDPTKDEQGGSGVDGDRKPDGPQPPDANDA